MRQETLRIRHLSKKHEAREALADINCVVFPGEIVGIVGLQDTGLSLLIEILRGQTAPDTGRILLNGEAMDGLSPTDAQIAGIHAVSWRAQLVPQMPVSMNLFFLSAASQKHLFLSPGKITAQARALLERYNVQIPPGKAVAALTQGEAYTVDLLRIAAQRPKLVILSDVLEENILVSGMFHRVMKQMLREKVSFLVVSNKVSAVVDICDRVHVLRDGVLTGDLPKNRLDNRLLLDTLLGEAAGQQSAPKCELAPLPARPVLALRERGGRRLLFTLREGEIVGLVPGEVHDYLQYLVRLVTDGGELLVKGERAHVRGLRGLLRRGIVVIPNHLEADDVFDKRPMLDNLALTLDRSVAGPLGFLNRRKCRYLAARVLETLDIDRGELERALASGCVSKELRQKLRIGRWIWRGPTAYVFLNPFADTDEKESEMLADILGKLARRGAGVLILSGDTYKLHSVCNRIESLP